MSKTFDSPNKACAYAMSYLHCSNAEVVVFKINGEEIVEFFIGKKEKAYKIISNHRGIYAIVDKNEVKIHKENSPFEYGLCLN